MLKIAFDHNKYKKELLIDCFQRKNRFNKPESGRPFYITFFEIIFITGGAGQFRLDEENINFSKGTVLLLPPNKWRQWNRINQKFDAVYLIFEEEFITRFFNDSLYLYRLNYFFNVNPPSYINIEDTHLKDYLNKLSEVEKEITDLKPDSEHLLRSLLYYLLISLNRQYQISVSQESFYKERPILKFKQLLEHNIASKHRVSDYSELLCISNSHLNKLVKEYFGKTASEVIKDRLIAEIKKHLLFTDMTIAEIGYELGFSEPSNFNRFFNSHVQMTPNDYRLQNDNH